MNPISCVTTIEVTISQGLYIAADRPHLSVVIPPAIGKAALLRMQPTDGAIQVPFNGDKEGLGLRHPLMHLHNCRHERIAHKLRDLQESSLIFAGTYKKRDEGSRQ